MSSIKSHRSPRKSKRSSKKKSKKKSASPKRRSTSRSRKKQLKVYVDFPDDWTKTKYHLYRRTLSPKQYIIRKNGTIKLPKYHISKDVYERRWPALVWKKLPDFNVDVRNSKKQLEVYVEFPGLALYKRTLSPKQYIIRKNGTIKLPKYHILKDVYERAYPPGTFDWKKLADYDVAQEKQMEKLRKSLYRENPNDLDTVQLRTIRARLQKFIRAHEAQGLYDYEVAINKPIRNKENIREALVKKLKYFYSRKNKKIVDNYLKKK